MTDRYLIIKDGFVTNAVLGPVEGGVLSTSELTSIGVGIGWTANSDGTFTAPIDLQAEPPALNVIIEFGSEAALSAEAPTKQ